VRHGEIDFAKISKNLARYRSENNLVWIIKIIMYTQRKKSYQQLEIYTNLHIRTNSASTMYYKVVITTMNK